MEFGTLIELIVAILAGLATAIPLVVKLVQYVQIAVEERRWDQIVALVLEYMQAAEGMFTDGSTKKEYVMSAIVASAQSIDYTLDDVALSKISGMIDSICDAAKVINAKTPAEAETDPV